MEEFLEFLNGDYFVDSGITVWNAAVEVVYGLLGVSPTGSTMSALWTSTSNLYQVFLSIGSALLMMFCVMAFCKDSIDLQKSTNLENIMKLFLRFLLANGIMTEAMTWIPQFFSWAIDLTNVSQKLAVTMDAEKIKEGFGEVPVAGFLLAFLFLLFCAAGGCILIYTISRRFLNLYLIIPLAPLALSTIAYGGGASQTAAAWFKSFLTYTFEIVLIGIVLMLSGSFIASQTFFAAAGEDAGITLSVLAMLDPMIKIGVVIGSVKGAEGMLRKAMGF